MLMFFNSPITISPDRRVTAQDENFKKMSETIEQLVKVELLATLSFMPSLISICPPWVYGESKLRNLRETVQTSLKVICFTLLIVGWYMTATHSPFTGDNRWTCKDSGAGRAERPHWFVPDRKAREGGTVCSKRKPFFWWVFWQLFYIVDQISQHRVSSYFWTDTMLIVTLLDLFNAGHETTATSLRWFYLYMMHYPEVQAKVQMEIDTEIGRDREPRWEDHTRFEKCLQWLNKTAFY